MPGRNPMPPPQLARDAPIVDVVHPVQVNLTIVLRRDGDLAALYDLNRALRQRLDLDEPLRRKSRLNHGAAAAALAGSNGVIFFAGKESLSFWFRQHAPARGVSRDARPPRRIF